MDRELIELCEEIKRTASELGELWDEERKQAALSVGLDERAGAGVG